MIMNKKICFLYSGQGSQYFGMCQKYYQQDSVFKEWMDKLDNIALNETGRSVIKYIYSNNDLNAHCDDITMTHIAIAMIEYSMTKSLCAKGIIPDIIAGASLGEYVCMAVSEMISIKKLIRFLADQSFLLKRKAEAGKMAAVIAEYNEFDPNLEGIEIASVDYSKHFVISGEKTKMENAINKFVKLGINVFDINVCYGFHSNSIEIIKDDMKKMIEKIGNMPESTLPIISSSKVDLIYKYNKDDLWNIIRIPIRFNEAVKKYFKDEECILIDVGPSSTLAGFCRNILNRQSGIYGIISPFNVENKNIDKLLNDLQQ